MTTIFDNFSNEREALDALLLLRHEYNALAPDWTQAPDWAMWYAILPHNKGFWFDEPEPLITYEKSMPQWINNSRRQFTDHIGLLPFGIDWRLCKWQRPVQP